MSAQRTAAAPAALSDVELMLRVQADDTEAFAALYDRFAARAHVVARAVVRSSHTEDIVQDAFLSVWRSRASFCSARGTVLGWIMGTVRNRAVDALRRNARHDARRVDQQGIEERLLAAGDIEDEVAARDEAVRLRETLTRLPPAQRDVIALAYFGELSASEIAAQLALPLGTVKGRMRLGLHKLRTPAGQSLPTG